MDEDSLFVALAERGTPRGGADVWRAAVSRAGGTVTLAGHDEDHDDQRTRGEAPAIPADDVLLALATDGSRHRVGRRPVFAAVVAAAAVLAVVSGLVAVRARQVPSTDPPLPPAPSTTIDAAPSADATQGALARLVVPVLPAGFQVVSTSRVMFPPASLVMAIDRSGRLLTVGYQQYNSELARIESTDGIARPQARSADGDASQTRVVTALGDVVTVSCVLGDVPCGVTAAEPAIDVRPLATAVASGVTPESQNDLSRSFGDSLMDSADHAVADTVLDRMAGSLGADYRLVSTVGDVTRRSWASTHDGAQTITVHALPGRVTTAATADGRGFAAATEPGQGWIFVAVANNAGGGAPPLDAASLRRVLTSSLATATTPAKPTTTAGDGRLALDPLPAGWSVESAYDRRTGSWMIDAISRIYASASATPERDASFTLVSSAAQVTLDPHGTDGVESIRVQGTAAQLKSVGQGSYQMTFGPVAGLGVSLTSTGIDRRTFLAVAEAVAPSPDGQGLVLPPAARPAGLVERAVGTPSDPWLQPVAAFDAPIPGAHWTDGRAYFWYTSMRADPSTLAIYRLGNDDVSDTNVNGHPAFVASRGTFRSAGWVDGDRIYLVGSNSTDGAGPGISTEQLLDLARKLRPATQGEWAAMIASRPAGADTPATTVAARTP